MMIIISLYGEVATPDKKAHDQHHGAESMISAVYLKVASIALQQWA
jgi:hypothetical protein